MKNSISNRLRNNFTILTLLVVLLTDIFLILGIKEFYYKAVESQLVNRLEISMDYYYKNYADRSLESLVSDEIDLLFLDVPSEIQILNKDGVILMDNIGVTDKNPINTSDIRDANTKNYGTWIGKNNIRNEFVIAVTSKIENSNNETIGYMRFLSSLKSQNSVIINTAIAIFAFSAVVMIIAITAATYIADTIVKPIRELTTIASLYIDGQYKSRANINTGDEIESLADALNALADEIVNKDKIKNDFISSISHELRTPLTSIKGWAVVLKDSLENEELMEDGLSIIEKESDRLSKMVEDLLDFSRFISGRITLDKDTFNITSTVISVAKQMKLRANLNGLEFITEIYPDIVITVGDENRIKQILINLLDNAIKFTSEKGWVKIKTEVENENFVIIVSDNGVGISKEEINLVKEKFYKGRHSKSHSGLGLSISEEIAKLHGGSLDIFSEENIGTVVKVKIPIVTEGIA
ncbi:HAMP domain-containing sensor histidine kinase [Peptoniphilus sp. BV3AC2]|uniref:sensor histidine kinase n=1 Tax=Peptoniphilus sp. BV3AC2 TaxID=1111133 RepID=UPI000687B145|nr:HAMP domain-containing sensor histidine kinase [Peptoniphilus sp. BV3AC2]